MVADVTTRAERPGDVPTIRGIVRRAYADVSYSDGREHRMIERLRETDASLPDLSLLAEIDGVPAGHVLLTRARIGSGTSQAETLALAPLSVVPELQRRGVGRSLVGAAHRRAAALGFGSIVLVGLPGYYPRFGYGPLGRYAIELPFAAPEGDRMILALRPGALDGVSGTVSYPPGWLDH